MRDDICTIPVSEGFEEKDGCPICRMRAIAEKRVIDYIMGAAMMEPDVRVSTNELGFCRDHFDQMMKAGNRLSLALILDSHLQEIDKQIFAEGKIFKPSEKKSLYKAVRLEETCFVCSKLNFGMSHMIDTVYRLYASDKDFRKLYSEQTELCLPHYRLLMQYLPEKWTAISARSLRRCQSGSRRAICMSCAAMYATSAICSTITTIPRTPTGATARTQSSVRLPI